MIDMEYLLAVIGGLIAGAVAAWAMANARTRATQVALNAKLEATERQLAERVAELGRSRDEQQQATATLQAESERRAAAQQSAARIPDLEARLSALQEEVAKSRARIAELEAQI